MVKLVLKPLRRVLHRYGVDLVRLEKPLPPDIRPEDAATFHRVRGFCNGGFERIIAMCDAVRYAIAADIPGGIVECGVLKGGMMMAAALTLRALGDDSRHLYLYDTYDGKPRPSSKDVSAFGEVATDIWETMKRSSGEGSTWAYASEDDVRAAMASTGYRMDRVHLIKGRVEDTLPGAAPAQISVLRLDTDFYESTRHELIHLYPRLSPQGVLVLDDYGHWLGARQATDEYLTANGVKILLSRTDYTARMGIKNGG